MGLLRNILIGRPDGLRSRLRRLLVSAGLSLAGQDGDSGAPAEPVSRRTTTPAQPRVVSPAAAPTAPTSVPEGFSDAAALEAVPDGGLLEVIVDGEPVALVRRGDEVRAVSAVCPHAGGPIADGDIDSGLVVCPWHGWSFELETGHCNVDDSITLPVYDVRVTDGRVLVRVT